MKHINEPHEQNTSPFDAILTATRIRVIFCSFGVREKTKDTINKIL
jgi:hypothetical protein